jgi:hypothetical protein
VLLSKILSQGLQGPWLQNKGEKMETEEKVIILAKIDNIKDMQIYLLKEEKKLRREYKRLRQLEEEREEVK